MCAELYHTHIESGSAQMSVVIVAIINVESRDSRAYLVNDSPCYGLTAKRLHVHPDIPNTQPYPCYAIRIVFVSLARLLGTQIATVW